MADTNSRLFVSVRGSSFAEYEDSPAELQIGLAAEVAVVVGPGPSFKVLLVGAEVEIE